MAVEAQILSERVVLNVHCLSVCLSVSEGKHRPLFAPTDVHKTSCNVQQLSVQRAIANLLFTIQDGRFSILDTVMFGYRYLILANHCHTAL
jgi:hypothetical protein